MNSENSPSPTGPDAPVTVKRFRVFCIGLCIIYFLVACVGGAALTISPEKVGLDRTSATLLGVLFLFIGPLFFFLAFIGFHMPQRPGAWTYNRFLLFLGISSIVLMPFALILLSAWVKPDVLTWYRIEE